MRFELSEGMCWFRGSPTINSRFRPQLAKGCGSRFHGMVFSLAALLLMVMGSQAFAGLENVRIPLVQSNEQAPVIDGKMQGSEWKYALAIQGLVSNEGPLTQRPATVYMVADPDNLYLGFYVPAVPEGTAPEVKQGPVYDGKSYMQMAGNDRMEIKIYPPNGESWGALYIVADAAANRYFEQIKGEHKAIQTDVDVKTSFDEKAWVMEIQVPAKAFGLEKFSDKNAFRVNTTVARVFPLKYDGLALGGPHAMSPATLSANAPAIQIEKLGDLPRGKLDLAVSVREYEGLVATPKETAYDERKVQSGGLKLAGSGHVARVSWELLDAQNKVVTNKEQILKMLPAENVLAKFSHDFTPGPKNALRLKVETAPTAADFTSGDPSKVSVEYQATIPFVPFVEEEAKLWQERLVKGTSLGSWRFNPAFFPYWQKAKAEITFFKGSVRDQAANVRVTITSDRGFSAQMTLPVVDGQVVTNTPDRLLEIPIPGLPEGTYTARGEVLNKNGEIVSSLERAYVRKVFAWEHNTLGLSRGVIKPWTPMSVEGNTVKCWGRDHLLDASGLPTQILSQGKSVLATPVQLDLRDPDGNALKWQPEGQVKFTETATDRVQWTGQAKLGNDLLVQVTGLAEYDGFTWFDVTLTPSKPVQISSGQIAIAIPDDQASLMHFQSTWARDNFSGAIPRGSGSVYRSLETINSGKPGGFTPHIWLGNLTRGLSWYADSNEGWSSIASKSAQEIVRTADQVRLELNIIAKPVVLDKPRTIRFGLMASPFKPLLPIRDIPTRAVNWVGAGDSKITIQDHMYAWYPRDFNYKLVDEHLPGWRLYFNKHEMGAALPEREVFDNEWGGMNPPSDYPGSPERFGPGLKSRAINRSLTDSRIDLIVYQIAQLAKNTKMGSTYWDITGIANGVPLLEEGMSYIDPETGNIVRNWDIRKSRELFKRVATMWQEIRGEPDYMEIHSTNHICPPFYSFAYNWLTFEWLWPGPKALRPDGSRQDFIDLRPLDLFATEGVPSQFGVWINSINGGQMPDDLSQRLRILNSGRALANLHNHGQSHLGGSNLLPPPTIGRRDQIEFVGYWDENKRVKTNQPKVLASYWKTADKIELVVANLTWETSPVSVRIPLQSLGWTKGRLISEFVDDSQVKLLRMTFEKKNQKDQLTKLQQVLDQAAAQRKPPELRVVDQHLEVTLSVPSHESRVFVIGKE